MESNADDLLVQWTCHPFLGLYSLPRFDQPEGLLDYVACLAGLGLPIHSRSLVHRLLCAGIESESAYKIDSDREMRGQELRDATLAILSELGIQIPSDDIAIVKLLRVLLKSAKDRGEDLAQFVSDNWVVHEALDYERIPILKFWFLGLQIDAHTPPYPYWAERTAKRIRKIANYIIDHSDEEVLAYSKSI